MVERVLGKDEVTGSIPVNGSILHFLFKLLAGASEYRSLLAVSVVVPVFRS